MTLAYYLYGNYRTLIEYYKNKERIDEYSLIIVPYPTVVRVSTKLSSYFKFYGVSLTAGYAPVPPEVATLLTEEEERDHLDIGAIWGLAREYIDILRGLTLGEARRLFDKLIVTPTELIYELPIEKPVRHRISLYLSKHGDLSFSIISSNGGYLSLNHDVQPIGFLEVNLDKILGMKPEDIAIRLRAPPPWIRPGATRITLKLDRSLYNLIRSHEPVKEERKPETLSRVMLLPDETSVATYKHYVVTHEKRPLLVGDESWLVPIEVETLHEKCKVLTENENIYIECNGAPILEIDQDLFNTARRSNIPDLLFFHGDTVVLNTEDVEVIIRSITKDNVIPLTSVEVPATLAPIPISVERGIHFKLRVKDASRSKREEILMKLEDIISKILMEAAGELI